MKIATFKNRFPKNRKFCLLTSVFNIFLRKNGFWSKKTFKFFEKCNHFLKLWFIFKFSTSLPSPAFGHAKQIWKLLTPGLPEISYLIWKKYLFQASFPSYKYTEFPIIFNNITLFKITMLTTLTELSYSLLMLCLLIINQWT